MYLAIFFSFLTVKDSSANKVKGQELRVGDYIVKSFKVVELLARIKAVLP
jgi:DNA-binding response OmpR family regulator